MNEKSVEAFIKTGYYETFIGGNPIDRHAISLSLVYEFLFLVSRNRNEVPRGNFFEVLFHSLEFTGVV